MLYRAQITPDCFHLVAGANTRATLCGENLVGRTRRPTSQTICRKCKEICLAHLNQKAPRVRILPPREGILRKCGNVTGPVEYIMRQGNHWWLGVDSGTRTPIPGHYKQNDEGKLVPRQERRYLATDECMWTDDEVEVVEGDLDWYGQFCECLRKLPTQT